MSRYRRPHEASYRPGESTSDSSDDDDDYGIASQDMPDIVYADQAYLQPAPSKKSYYSAPKVTPPKPLRSILKSISSFGQQRESAPLVSTDSLSEDDDTDIYYQSTPQRAKFATYRVPGSSSSESDDSSSEPSKPLEQVFPRRGSGWDTSNIRPPSSPKRRHQYTEAQYLVVDVWYRISDLFSWIYEVLDRLRTVILHALKELGSWLWHSVGPATLVPSILLLATVYAFLPNSNMTGELSNWYPNSPDSLVSFSDFAKPHHTQAAISKTKFSVGRSVMDIITGGNWPGTEPEKREVELQTVETLQGRYAESARSCREMLDITRAALAHHPDIVQLWQFSRSAEWDKRGLANEHLGKAVKLLGRETNKQLDDFRKRAKIFYGKVKEEDLKLVNLAGQIKAGVQWPFEEQRDTRRKGSAWSLLSKRKEGTADFTTSSVVDKEEDDRSLEAAKILHLVTSNLVSTSGWIDAATNDVVAVTSLLRGLIAALEKASFEADKDFSKGGIPLWDYWEKILNKAKESGLSSQAAERLAGLPGRLVTAREAIEEVLSTLVDVRYEMKQLSNELSVPNKVLAPRWTVKDVIQLYETMASAMDESIKVLRMPPELQ
ncbi:hypothetical protein QBC40DRAFT_97066 [Triangularia verruculosa]|uniref:Uncharacterized protein n=1 Tax=Triangularia verruculosa TaxID=2587418 RepID=A0AAN6XCT0_9PEZI|nr:hypothetical protein QBC40DRAFT_97066 [Triangularia verruculosa]